jgi:hypothetical protein
MKKTTGMLTLSAALLASMSVSALAASKYQAVGTLDCAFTSGGSPDAILCEFQSHAGGSVELYFAQVDKAELTETNTVHWDVLKPVAGSAYAAGGLSGHYLASGATSGLLIGASESGLLLQAGDGPALESGISFFKLRKVEQ